MKSAKPSEHRALQVVVAIASLVPILAGVAGVVTGGGFLGEQAASAPQDSHFRYLSGLLLAIGIAYASAIPSIERRSTRFALLTAVVVIGGVARLTGVLLTGALSGSILFPLVMELVVTPGLCLWQHSLARRSSDSRDGDADRQLPG